MSDKIILFGDEIGLSLIKQALPELRPAGVVYSFRRPQALIVAGSWEGDNCLVMEQPSARDPQTYQSFLQRLNTLQPELGLCCSYDLIFDRQIMDLFQRGIFNIHGSLLPRYRGANALNWVLINGEKETGVTLHRVTDKVDAGPVVHQLPIPIADNDTARSLRDKISLATVELLKDALPLLRQKPVPCCPQDEQQASVVTRRRPEDGFFDWHWPSMQIYNLIRALVKPWPGAWYLEGDRPVVINDFLSLEEVERRKKEILGYG